MAKLLIQKTTNKNLNPSVSNVVASASVKKKKKENKKKKLMKKRNLKKSFYKF